MPLTLGELYYVIDARLDKLEAKVKQASQVAQRGGKQAGSAFGDAFGTASLAAVSVAAGAFAKQVFDATVKMARLEAGMTALMGSSKAAAAEIEKLRKTAMLPGVSFEQATKASQAFQAVGISADYSRRMIEALSKLNARAGGDPANFGAAVTQMQQMVSLGRVTMEDLKPMMQRMPELASVMKDAFGTASSEKIQKMFESGKLSMREFVGQMVEGMEKLKGVPDNLANEFDNLQDAIDQATTKIGKDFEPAMRFAVKTVSDAATGWNNLSEAERKNIEQMVLFGPIGSELFKNIQALTMAVHDFGYAWGIVGNMVKKGWEANLQAFGDGLKQMFPEIGLAQNLAGRVDWGKVGGFAKEAGGAIIGGLSGPIPVKKLYDMGFGEMRKAYGIDNPFDPKGELAGAKAGLMNFGPAKNTVPNNSSFGGSGKGGGSAKPWDPADSLLVKGVRSIMKKVSEDFDAAESVRKETQAMKLLTSAMSDAEKMAIRLDYGLERVSGGKEAQAKRDQASAADIATLPRGMEQVAEGVGKAVKKGLDFFAPWRKDIADARRSLNEFYLDSRRQAGASETQLLQLRRSLGMSGATTVEGRGIEDQTAKLKDEETANALARAEVTKSVTDAIAAGVDKLRKRHEKALQAELEYIQAQRQLDERMEVATSKTGAYDVELRHLAETFGDLDKAKAVMARVLDVQKAEAYRAEIERLRQTFEDFIMQTLDDTLKNGFDGFFRNLISGFQQTLAQMARDWIAFQVRSGVQSLVGSLFGGAFGATYGGGGGEGGVLNTFSGGIDGALASGGPAIDGRAYLVGEQGPEIFVPGSTGRVYDAQTTSRVLSGGGSSVVVNVTVNANDAGSFVRSKDQIAAEVGRAIEKATRKAA